MPLRFHIFPYIILNFKR